MKTNITDHVFRFLLILLVCASTSSAVIAQIVVTGKITDESGAGLPGATIMEKGTTNGTAANVDGTYSWIRTFMS